MTRAVKKTLLVSLVLPLLAHSAFAGTPGQRDWW